MDWVKGNSSYFYMFSAMKYGGMPVNVKASGPSKPWWKYHVNHRIHPWCSKSQQNKHVLSPGEFQAVVQIPTLGSKIIKILKVYLPAFSRPPSAHYSHVRLRRGSLFPFSWPAGKSYMHTWIGKSCSVHRRRSGGRRLIFWLITQIWISHQKYKRHSSHQKVS